nr:SufE-like protein 1, chloroplastic/mitochondrial [Tanacetum cinerariifolium]
MSCMVRRQRIIYSLLNDELQNGLHALSIEAKTPAENSVEEDDNVEGSFVGIENAFEESYIEVDDTGWEV